MKKKTTIAIVVVLAALCVCLSCQAFADYEVNDNGRCSFNNMEELIGLIEYVNAHPDTYYDASAMGLTITEDVTIPKNLKLDFFSSFSSITVAKDVIVRNYGYIFWANQLTVNGTIINEASGTLEADFWDGYYIADTRGSGTIVNRGTVYLNWAERMSLIQNEANGVVHLLEPQISSMEKFYQIIEMANEMPYMRLTTVMKEPMLIDRDLILPENVEALRCSYARDGYGLIVYPDATFECNIPWVISSDVDIQGTLRNNNYIKMSKDVRVSGVIENQGTFDFTATLDSTLAITADGCVVNNGSMDAYYETFESYHGEWIPKDYRDVVLNGTLINNGTMEAGKISGQGKIVNTNELDLCDGGSIGSLENSKQVTITGDMRFLYSIHSVGEVTVNLFKSEEILSFAGGFSFTNGWSSYESLGCLRVYVANEARSNVTDAVNGLDFVNSYIAERHETDLMYTYYNDDRTSTSGHIAWEYVIRPKAIPDNPFPPPTSPLPALDLDNAYVPTEDELEQWRKDYQYGDTGTGNKAWTFSSGYGLAALLLDRPMRDFNGEYLEMYYYTGDGSFEIPVNITIPSRVYVYSYKQGYVNSMVIPEGITVTVEDGSLITKNLIVYGVIAAVSGNLNGTVWSQNTLTNEGLLYLDNSNSWIGVEENGYFGTGVIRISGVDSPDPARLEGIDLSRFEDEYNTISKSHLLIPRGWTDIRIFGQPVDTSVFDGEIATLHVNAAGADITYQWQTRRRETPVWVDTDLNGAKTDTLIVPGLQSYDGNIYRCIIRNSKGSQLSSSEVTLSVMRYDDSLILPGSLSVIEDYAFTDARIVEVIFPAGLQTIGKMAFNACNQLRVAVFETDPAEIATDAFSKSSILTFVGPTGGTVQRYAAWKGIPFIASD